MSESQKKSISTLYWSKSKKKNITKSVALKKFAGDETKAKEFLQKWKDEQKVLDEAELNKQSPEMKTEISEVPAIVTEEKKEEQIKSELPEITYTKFVLNMPNLKEDACSTVIYGSSKAGKTTQAMKLMNDYFGDKNVIRLVFSPNIHSKVYAPLKDKDYIKIDRWDDQIIRDIHKIQKKTKNKYCFLVCIDDCILEKLSPQILQLLLVLRNSKINTLLNLQSVTLLSRNGRNNGNNFIFKNFNNDEVINDAMNYFLGSFKPFLKLPMDDKIVLYKEITRDYGFIYLNALDGLVSFHKK
jgi:hypothetical protein